MLPCGRLAAIDSYCVLGQILTFGESAPQSWPDWFSVTAKAFEADLGALFSCDRRTALTSIEIGPSPVLESHQGALHELFPKVNGWVIPVGSSALRENKPVQAIASKWHGRRIWLEKEARFCPAALIGQQFGRVKLRFI